MDKLLPCPFCGGEAESKMYLWGHHAETHEPIWCYYIYCTSCDAMTDNVFKSKTEAVAAWNRRAQPENKPLTNSDRFRRMSDEEIAKILVSDLIGEKIPFCKNKPECDKILDSGECIPESMCVECALDWLKKEVVDER